ncbi:chromate efflux transporter [Haloprofundus salilacus]|uniref:chromate efflux transporter n=1 Tax=Haloprofundus salilacus TaxID=2876190 RepID=UPI001CCF099D|nr:chromate efflux transporter [Haloprofundus salilacus]
MGGGDTVPEADRYAGRPTRRRLMEIARFFLKIGLVGFGGPLVHIAMMEDELVGEGSREWLDETRFMEALAICNTLPGPASTQLGIFMGWVRGGLAGAFVAGVTFMAPTFLIVVAFSYVYFAYGQLPSVEAVFRGINPVVIGLIAGSAYSMTRSALRQGRADFSFSLGGEKWRVDYLLSVLLVGALVATVLVAPNPVLEFVVAGCITVLVYRTEWVRANLGRVATVGALATVAAVLYGFRDALVGSLRQLPLPATLISAFAALWANTWVKLFLFMLYTGSFIYGGGLVLIPFIETYVVGEFGWLTAREFVDGIAIGQLTPGPVVMTTAFVGYALFLPEGVGWAVVGAFVAMVGAFAPSFVFVVAFFPYVARVRENEVVKTALLGVNAAVVGAIIGATVSLSTEAILLGSTVGTVFAAGLAVAAFLLFVRGVDAAYLIIGGGVLGLGFLLF